MSEASSSGLQQQQQQRSGDEWREEEECPRCAAMKVNAIVAEEALAALSVQFKNLQKELKISESCMSEASSSGLQQQHQRSGDEWREEEECPRCAAMKVNAIVAEEALAALSVQFKNLQKELKKTEQVSKINEEQARYIDERRSKLEKVEAERTAISAEFENLRVIS
ncbi:unnamed protein product [Gongylonema pulchrum]|uniref:Uncharacterized protein n=1 Tax=Gongylonema pulchrum TaxID=637853 RepID=A0A183EUM2_9BILA|nr:unnamed protein product [Gongylonema pulchrum]